MKKMIYTFQVVLVIAFLIGGCDSANTGQEDQLYTKINHSEGTISVFKGNQKEPIVVQNARPEHRPYLHPIAAPDGKGFVTEYSPGHHKHQTGLYWGFTRVNGEPVNHDSLMTFFYKPDKTAEQVRIKGRDFFHNPGEGYWKRISYGVIDSIGEKVSWKSVYHMLAENGEPLLEETQIWSMKVKDGEHLLELEWQGKALEEITIGEMSYGGLFLRMPWKEGIKGEVVNFARQRNERAEGQRAQWTDVGIQVEGREDLAHVAIFDHPENGGFPQTWRVDGQLGIGPSRAIMGDWKIPKGETETIKHGFVIYTGELNDIELTEKWKQYIDDDLRSIDRGHPYNTGLWRVAREEGRLAKFLTAEQQVAEMTVTDGYKVNAWASEPMITQPMAFCWDDRGRLWIAENRDYETRRTGFSGSGDSRILIIEDTDKDGVADSRKVFAEGIAFPAALAVGFEGVFVGAPPNLLFIPDRDGDDKADMDDIEVRLTGWGIRDRHETINSFHWGPDGWLYGLEGFATPSKIRKPIGKGKIYRHNDPFPEDLLEAEGVDVNGGVWRYHPTKDRFEAVAHGFSNPWGIDYDAKGQLFISACVIPHLFHVVPGGIYHRQGGQHFSSYIYDDIKTIVDHRHRSAHGGARIYLSDAFPPEQRNRIFMANIHEHAVLSDILEPKGSGFVAKHGEDFVMANNAQWIGFSMEIGPEGGLYVLDWHDADICGTEVLHKETGRIYRIMPEQSQAKEWKGRYADLGQFSDLELAELQLSPSVWHARRARVILQERAAKGTIGQEVKKRLFDIYQKESNIDLRLRGFWSLHVTGQLSESDLLAALSDSDEYIRGWAIQLLGEDMKLSPKAIQQLEAMSSKDKSPIVRLYLAAVLQRIPINERWNISTALTANKQDKDDHNIPKMIWFGLEPTVATDIERALDLGIKSKIPVIAEYIARRVIDENGMEQLLSAAQKRSPNQMSLLQGLLAELENNSDLKPTSNWDKTYEILRSNEATAAIALEIGQLFGSAEAANQLMTVLENPAANIEDRQAALTGLASRAWPALKPLLSEFIDNPDMSIQAIRAISNFNDGQLGQVLFGKYETFSADQKTEALMTLASRRTYASILTGAIKDKRIAKSEIPAYVARQLRRVMGNGFVEVWGPIDDISADIEAQYSKYRKLLTNENLQRADAIKGKGIFSKTCGACHQMYGEGGILGPELTGSNRSNTDYLLSNILEPSADIQDDYKMVIVTTRDGRTYLGTVAGDNDRQLVLKVVGQDQLSINKSDIQSREDTPNSMMPPGLINTMNDQEVLDLVAYLKTQKELAAK
ncbi:MAG: PmoA family protein [Bacteroidetes bacterium]|nr:PmoA family protein [Bacteroidota bacterium]